MNTALMGRSRRYFDEQVGFSLDKLLDPIDSASPAGYSVKGNGVYNTIQNARREDDASLPLGPWEHKLKRADWPVVSRTAAEALGNKTKDLQVAVWLLEAQVNQHGFAALAPGLLLIDGLLRTYWNDLYPQDADSGGEHRANILRSLNSRLPGVLKQIALTATGTQRDYRLADWDLALHQERLVAAAPAGAALETEVADLETIAAAMAATQPAWYESLCQQLDDALVVMRQLKDGIDSQFAEDGPSLSLLAALLEQIHALAGSELRRRGVGTFAGAGVATASAGDAAVCGDEAPIALSGAQPSVTDRQQVYAQLEQLAEMLLRMDPHSPSPYLIRRAIEWGRLNTAELYHEVFIRLGGQLNIFELLGLENQAKQEAA